MMTTEHVLQRYKEYAHAILQSILLRCHDELTSFAAQRGARDQVRPDTFGSGTSTPRLSRSCSYSLLLRAT